MASNPVRKGILGSRSSYTTMLGPRALARSRVLLSDLERPALLSCSSRRSLSGKTGPIRLVREDDPPFTKGYWYIIFLLGLAQGALVSQIYLERYIHPLPLPENGDVEDQELRRTAEEKISRLPVVRQMRDPTSGYVEWTAYSSMDEQARIHRVSTGAMGGMRCLGVQKLFYNAAEKRLLNVVYFGPASCGWPGVVHGGAIATVVDETCGRVAVRNMSSRTGVTANLQVDYKAMISSDGIYIIEVGLDPTKSTDRKAIVRGIVSDTKGKLLTKVSGVFVTPSKFKLAPIPETF